MGIFGKAYFGRKVEEGKNKLAVLNALGNKLLNCIFSVVKQGTKWEAEISKVKETPLLKDSPHKPPPSTTQPQPSPSEIVPGGWPDIYSRSPAAGQNEECGLQY
jgi:hypothetical protein